tara:strand:+ start:3570 stop:4877 length:1308 start_codon:yes stop_codon:yes gene_type:complete
MKSLKLNNINLFNFFIIFSQSLILVNFISLYTLTQYKALKIGQTLRLGDIVGPYFRPNDKPGFGYSISESVVGYHFFGDLTELMFYAKNIGKNLEILDLQIQYPPATLFFLKLFQNLELINTLFILLLVSVILNFIAIRKFELEVNKYLFLFVIIFTSKSFLFSIDRGNLEFFVFAIFLLGLAFKKENQKISLILFIFACSLKPSVLLLMIFLKFSSLFLVGIGFLISQTIFYIYLKVNPLEGFLHYISNLNNFSSIYPLPLDTDISNLSVWSMVGYIRHLDFILNRPSVGNLLQGLLNHSGTVAILLLIIYFLFIKFMNIDIYNSTIHLASYISITLLLRDFTAYYSSIFLVIPLIIFFANKKPKKIEITTAFFIFLSLQPIQIFIDRDYLTERLSLELFYRFSASSFVLVICIITVFYNYVELKNYKKNKTAQ